MKFSFAVAALPAIALATAAHAAEQRYTVTSFDAIEAAGPYSVVVTTGKAGSVRAVGDQDDLDRLGVDVVDRTLKIRRRSDAHSWLSFGDRSKPVTVYVTAERLEGARLAGSGDVKIDRMAGDKVGLSLAGSGNLDVGAVKATKLDISIAGSGDVSLGGTCDSVKMSIAGSGDINAAKLKCATLDGRVSGSGNVSAEVDRIATLKIMGSGDVTLSGKAKCDVSAMGSGRVRCGA